MRFWLVLGLLISLSSTGCRTTGSHVVQKDPKNNLPSMVGEILATQTAIDWEKGQISYTLDQPAYVRLRVGLNQGGALLHHVLDWQRREAGRHVEKWDKKDATGKIDFGNRSDYLIVIKCLSVKNGGKPTPAPELNIVFPQSGETTPQGDPVVSGIVPLRIAASAKDTQWLNGTLFEVAMYVDYVFLMEEEAGTNPFNFQLDTSKFQEGLHTLTVNVIAFSGEVGTQSINFYVKHLVNKT